MPDPYPRPDDVASESVDHQVSVTDLAKEVVPEKPTAPRYHYGATEKGASLEEVLGFGISALRDAALKVEFDPKQDPSTPVLIGSSKAAMVFVGCGVIDPRRTWVMVAAVSSDSSTAEQLRNKVRAYIDGVISVDNPEDGTVPAEPEP